MVKLFVSIFRMTMGAVMLAAMLVTLSSEEALAKDGTFYTSNGYLLEVPNKYKDALITNVFADNNDGVLFSVSEKKSVEESKAAGMQYDGMGWLFSIGKINEKQLNEMLCYDMSGVEIFAKDISGMYYVFRHPTDVRFHRSTIEEMKTDQDKWTELVQWGYKFVRDEFVKNNPGLVPVIFSNDEVMDSWRNAMAAYKGYNDGSYKPSPAWVQQLPEAKNAKQLFVVAGIEGTTAWVSMHERDWDGKWKEIMTTPGFIGKKGFGKTKEGDSMTPVGTFGFNAAFGIAPDPGCAIPYRQVDGNIYWSGDIRPGMKYNEMVDIRNLPDLNKGDSEHIVDYNPQYIYCMNISYNAEGTPNKGSAIFLHCFGPNKPYTGGCVAIPLEKMEFVMKHVHPDCVVVINTLEKLGGSF